MLGAVKYGFFFILCLLGIGQTFLYLRIKKMWSLLDVVEGKITSSFLYDLTGRGTGFREYEAIIEFKYNYQGKAFDSKIPVLRSPQTFPNYRFERELLEKYKEGASCEVRVHPDAPELAFLEIAPMSKASIVILPLTILGYLAYLTGAFYYLENAVQAFV